MNKSLEIVTDRILALMEQGQIPWAKPWRGPAYAPRNATSDREYSGVNAFLLNMAGYSVNRYLTYKQAQEGGGSVRKGEHGWPVIYVNTVERENKETGKLEKIPFLKHFTVFNVSQCENLPEKYLEPVTIGDVPPLRECEEILAHMPNAPVIHFGSSQACYNRATDEISMPERNQFKDSPSFYDTLYHEAAHSTGHQSRVGRFQPGTMHKFGSKEYGREELIAEITAAALCHETGIFDAIERNTTAYLQSWIKAIKTDKSALASAVHQGERAVDYILSGQSASKPETTNEGPCAPPAEPTPEPTPAAESEPKVEPITTPTNPEPEPTIEPTSAEPEKPAEPEPTPTPEPAEPETSMPEPAGDRLLVLGDFVDDNSILRSIDLVAHTATLEFPLKPRAWKDEKSYHNLISTFKVVPLGEVHVDTLYRGQVLHRMVEYAQPRLVGKHKISKACFRRLEAQLQAAA